MTLASNNQATDQAPDKLGSTPAHAAPAGEISLKDLIAQRHALDEKINEAHKLEKAKAISDVKSIVGEYNLCAADVFGGARQSKSGPGQKSKVEQKYIDKETGKTWSGRGVAPKWIAGKDRELFRIA